jgi:hypothetical protein
MRRTRTMSAFTTSWYWALIDALCEDPGIQTPVEDTSVPVLDSGNIDNNAFSYLDNINLHVYPELNINSFSSECKNNSLYQSFDLVKEKPSIGILNNINSCSGMVNDDYTNTDNSLDSSNITYGIYGNSFHGLFDIFSVNRRDSILQLLASDYIDKHVNWAEFCAINSVANCYFANYFSKKPAFYCHNVNVELSHCLALLSRFDDLECVASRSFVNICTFSMIFVFNICTFARNNINLLEKFTGMCYEPVCTSPALPRLFCF